MKKIELVLPKDTNTVSGFVYGESIYNEQVKNKYNKNEKLIIKFPDYIERVGSSFVQGFFSDIISSRGYEFIEDNIEIESNSDRLTRRIRKRIE